MPDICDVADELGNYLVTIKRAEELDEKIAKIDDLIDESVYELCGLSDENIEVMEGATTE